MQGVRGFPRVPSRAGGWDKQHLSLSYFAAAVATDMDDSERRIPDRP